MTSKSRVWFHVLTNFILTMPYKTISLPELPCTYGRNRLLEWSWKTIGE